jgi:hypothetical protein
LVFIYFLGFGYNVDWRMGKINNDLYKGLLNIYSFIDFPLYIGEHALSPVNVVHSIEFKKGRCLLKRD